MVGGMALLVPGDEELLAEVGAGDRAAFGELFRRYRQIADRVAHRLLGNDADALDAVQEAFVKALQHLAKFEGRSTFKTWFLRVVSNAALDLGRKRGRRETVSVDAIGAKNRRDLEPIVLQEPDHGLERSDLRRKLQEALEQLSPATADIRTARRG